MCAAHLARRSSGRVGTYASPCHVPSGHQIIYEIEPVAGGACGSNGGKQDAGDHLCCQWHLDAGKLDLQSVLCDTDIDILSACWAALVSDALLLLALLKPWQRKKGQSQF